jgi:hypothetical protein
MRHFLPTFGFRRPPVAARQEAEKDAADRASIAAALARQLAKGDKALVGNAGYRRYVIPRGEMPAGHNLQYARRVRAEAVEAWSISSSASWPRR